MMMKMVIPRTSNIPSNMNPMICAMIGHDSHSATLGSEMKSFKEELLESQET